MYVRARKTVNRFSAPNKNIFVREKRKSLS